MSTSSRLDVRTLEGVGELAAAERLWTEVWASAAEVPISLLRALAFTGSYVGGAFLDGDLVGAALGFPTGEGRLHSHVTGVRARARGHGVGLALKQHQRRWCLERGIEQVSWTFDPLQRANAQFNLARLGARVTAYLPDFYGVMDDALNAGDATDRLLVVWDLRRPVVPPDLSPETLAATPALVGTSADGRPQPGPLLTPYCRLEVPDSADRLRREQPGLLGQWRCAVREAFVAALDADLEVAGFVDRRAYLLVAPS